MWILTLERKAALKLKPRRLCSRVGAFTLGFNVLQLLCLDFTLLVDLPQLF